MRGQHCWPLLIPQPKESGSGPFHVRCKSCPTYECLLCSRSINYARWGWRVGEDILGVSWILSCASLNTYPRYNTGALRLFYDTPPRLRLSTAEAQLQLLLTRFYFTWENQQRLAAANAVPGGECTADRGKIKNGVSLTTCARLPQKTNCKALLKETEENLNNRAIPCYGLEDSIKC